MTVSIGEDTRGVFREIRLVTGVSRPTSEAENPNNPCQWKLGIEVSPASTDIAWQNQEVVVGQSSIVPGVEKSLCI